MEEQRLYKITEAAQRLGVTRKTLYNWRREGKIAFVKVGEQNRIANDELERFIVRSNDRRAMYA